MVGLIVNAQSREEACGVPLVFHLQNNYLKQQARHFGDRAKNVTGKQLHGTIQKRLERLFLQFSIDTLARDYEIRERRAAESQSDQCRLTFESSTYILVGILVDVWPTFAAFAKVWTDAACVPILTVTADLIVPTFTRNVKGGPSPKSGLTGSAGSRNARCSSQYTVP